MKKTVICRDIGVYIENDQPQICYLDTTTNQFYSAKNPKQAVDKNVTLVKDLFTVKESTDDYFAQTVEPIKAENTVLDFIRTQKAHNMKKFHKLNFIEFLVSERQQLTLGT